MQDLKKLCCATILDLTVMLQHTSVSNCFYYMIVWYVLSIYAESNTHNYKPITAVGGVYFWVNNPPRLLKQIILMRGLKTGQKIAYYF